MLSREDNDLVTRVGKEAPLGRLMRRYWLPALLAHEIAEPDGAPVRVRLLGEPLVAFRDSAGRIGLVDEFCAHRRVSLVLGRNEESGLRCVYHGWKYDVDGRCVDMPTEPPETDFRSRIRLAAYPTVELGGVIWAYLGDGEPPAPPCFEWTGLRDDQRVVTRTWQECNWLQALEGGIDSAHASALHTVLTPDTERAGLSGLWTVPVPVRDEVEVTDYGHAYASIRPMPGEKKWVKVYHWVMPCHTFFPFELGGDGETLQPIVNGHVFVPMDDENTMVYNWIGKYGEDPLGAGEREMLEWSRGRAPGEIGDGHRKLRNRDVDWLIDRAVQKTETYSGIEGINNQDHAVQESMGPIVDRTRENLGTTDAAVIATRRILLARLRNEAPDEDPPGVAPTYYGVRAIERVVDAEVDWRTELRHLYRREGDGPPSP